MQQGLGSASSAAPNNRAGASAGVSRPEVSDSNKTAPMIVILMRSARPAGPAACGQSTTAVPARHAKPKRASAHSAGFNRNGRFGGASGTSGAGKVSGLAAWFIYD